MITKSCLMVHSTDVVSDKGSQIKMKVALNLFRCHKNIYNISFLFVSILWFPGGLESKIPMYMYIQSINIMFIIIEHYFSDMKECFLVKNKTRKLAFLFLCIFPKVFSK